MQDLTERLFQEILKIPITDPHTHIDPRRPTARDLDDLLGYHYYTELAHSAGMSQEVLRSEVPAEERARAMSRFLPAFENTVQYGWLLEIAKSLFAFPHERIEASNVDELWKASETCLVREGWAEDLLHRCRIERVFLTNDFDDDLSGFDTGRYVPCLRVDELVFQLGKPAVVERLRQSSGTDAGNASSLRQALGSIVRRFVEKGARACAVSLPPDFAPQPVATSAVDPVLRRALSGRSVTAEEERQVSHFVVWLVAEMCAEQGLPLDLMVGVSRNVYPAGVRQGRDLFNQLTSLQQYQALFNSFPKVIFPVSVLSSNSNQELMAYSWIFPNVVTSGHWWYSNLPACIERDLAARLQGVPRTKQIGYYSDAYKLEFVLPKFNTYRRALAKVLAGDFVVERRWSEEKALSLAEDLLRRNVERIFFAREEGREPGRGDRP